MVSVFPRRRREPVVEVPPVPDAAAAAVFPVLGSGIFLIPHDQATQTSLGPVIWDVFPMNVTPRQRALEIIRCRFNVAAPILDLATAEPTTLINSSDGDNTRLLEVTCFFVPARDLLATADFPGQRRLARYQIEHLLHSPGLLMPEAAQLLPAVIRHWSSGQRIGA